MLRLSCLWVTFIDVKDHQVVRNLFAVCTVLPITSWLCRDNNGYWAGIGSHRVQFFRAMEMALKASLWPANYSWVDSTCDHHRFSFLRAYLFKQTLRQSWASLEVCSWSMVSSGPNMFQMGWKNQPIALAGFANWRAGWSEGKKLWCCQHYSQGCQRPSDLHVKILWNSGGDTGCAWHVYRYLCIFMNI